MAHIKKHSEVHCSTGSSLEKAYPLFFGTLANESRLKIVNVLRKRGKNSNGSKNVSEICAATGFEQSMVSHNLKELEYHGMVFMQKKGKFRYYTVNEKTIAPLLELIDAHMKEYCCEILEGKR
ncbi:helix-turn-helix transcriptional regulator [Candidatus Woesearchaeota archaeon]|nr:helix-turn-helix transcriptional regulator [Candidatus Woesearchaeota archaeon]